MKVIYEKNSAQIYFLRLEKKVAFVFFAVKSLSNLGKSMSITKSLGKISFEILPDFEVSLKYLKNKQIKLYLPTFLLF
jgi:hypothetical protein